MDAVWTVSSNSSTVSDIFPGFGLCGNGASGESVLGEETSLYDVAGKA
jgi:hypothetical protein